MKLGSRSVLFSANFSSCLINRTVSVTDVPSDRRMTTKTTSYHCGATKSISGASKRSSLVGVGGGGGDHSHRYNERNSTVVEAKLFGAVDMKALDQSDREDLSRVFALAAFLSHSI